MRARADRNGKIAPRRRKGRVGSALFFLGILGVLGTTFAVGALAGRMSVSPSARADDRAAKPNPPTPPTLTFYRELTAPLATPPPPPPPSRTPARPHKDKPKAEAPAAEMPRRADANAGTSPSASPGVPDGAPRAESGRYTVQVGSYNSRAQADALRVRLGAAGHPAYVAEGDAGGTTRYRVRVGSFATMEEARQAAVRLGSEARVATYVTTR